MSGRYTDWTHVHVVGGDNTAAAPYVPEARKLLGRVADEARRHGLTTHVSRRWLPDGTAITAELRGGIPRITIAPVSAPAQKQVIERRHFVVWGRNTALPDGIHADYPQQILTPGEEGWAAFTYDSNTAGNRDGTYRDAFPDGIPHAGNIDWLAANGVRISYYGPSTRYWYDLWRRPGAQYGRWVFLNGHVLLDIEQYLSDSAESLDERYVVGAALVGNHLWVMQASIAELAPLNAGDYPAGSLHAWISPPLPPGDSSLRLCRYTVAKNPAPVGNADLYRVVTGSRLEVWTHTARGYVNPWVFSPDGLVCETFAMPDELRGIVELDTTTTPFTRIAHVVQSPSSEATTVTIDATSGTAAHETIALSVDASGAYGDYRVPVAVDYSRDGVRKLLYYVARLRPGDTRAWLEIEGDPPVPLWDEFLAEARLVNIRDSVIVVWRAPASLVNAVYTAAVYVAGVEVASKPIATLYLDEWPNHWPGAAPNTERSHDGTVWGAIMPVAGTTVSPMAVICGVSAYSERVTYTPGVFVCRTSFQFSRLYKHYETFADSEIVGWTAYFRNSNSGGPPPAPSAQVLPGSTDGTLRGLDALMSGGYAIRADKKGMRIPESCAADGHGNVVASIFVPLSLKSQPATPANSYFRRPAMINFCTGGDLSIITGVPAYPGPAQEFPPPGERPYDARFSTIWLLGKWPNV